MVARSGEVESGHGIEKQHVDLWRKIGLRRRLLTNAIAGAAYVPYIGDGDIAIEVYKGRSIYGCDLDEARVATAKGRLEGSDVRVADAEKWAFGDITVPFAIADFDAYANPYRAVEAFWKSATTADRVVIFGTDGMRMKTQRSTSVMYGSVTAARLSKAPDKKTNRDQYYHWWAKWVRPFLAELVAPATIIAEEKFQRREHMLYWGVVVEKVAVTQSAPEPPAATPESSLREAAVSGNVPAAIFLMERAAKEARIASIVADVDEGIDDPRMLAALDAFRQGATVQAAAGAGGVTRATIYRWIDDSETFRDAVDKAQNFAHWKATKAVSSAWGDNWQSAMTWLERRDPKHYARRERIDMHIELEREIRLIAEQTGQDFNVLLQEAEQFLLTAGKGSTE